MSKILYSSQIKYLRSLRRPKDKLSLEMEDFAKENNVPILDWKSLDFMEQLILMTNPKRILEIGTAIGYSTIGMAKIIRKKGKIDSIEKSNDQIKLAKNYFKKAKVEDKINLIEGDAFDVMPNLEKKYDLIFLDADKEDYEKLFYYSIMLLKKNGILFVDNLLWHGYAGSSKVPSKFKDSTKHIRKFNEMFLSHSSLHSKIYPIGDGVGVAIKIK